MLQGVADDIIAAAAAFGPEKESFAKLWVDKALAGESPEVGVIDECLIDDDSDQCQALEEAMRNFNRALGRFDGLNS